LENLERIILCSRSTDLLNVHLAIAFKWLLSFIGVVEIDEWVVFADASCVFVELGNIPIAMALEEVVLRGTFPCEVGLEHFFGFRVSYVDARKMG